MAYIDVPETGNVDLKLDEEKEIVAIASKATYTFTDAILTFSVVEKDDNGMYKIAGADIGLGIEIGDQIIVRGSVQVAAGEDPYVNNDGLYTVKWVEGADAYIYVEEPVVAATSDEVANVEEYDTFILHPTRPTAQMCIYIIAAATPSAFEVSFKPGGYWASKIEIGLPEMQGEGVLNKAYLVQVETAPFLQTEEEILIADPEVDKKGTLLMRVFPVASEALTTEVDVALVQLA